MALPGRFSLKAEGPGNPAGRSNAAVAMTDDTRPPGLIQRYREELQARHYARRTVDTYVQWLRRYLRFHQLRHPREMGSAEVTAFLTHLAVEGQVSASTQNQALVAQLLYGGGLRLMEALRLRIKDGELEQRCITVRCGKGDKDRRTVLPSSLVDPLKRHMKEVQHQHQTDLCRVGRCGVAPCPGEEIQECRQGMGLAMAVSPGPTLAGSAPEHRRKAPSRSEPRAEGRAFSRAGCGDQQTGDLPHLPPFIRHAPTGTGRRHPHDSGTTRPQRCENHHGLYPCAEQRSIWGTQPR